jgi:thymidylate synthase (FAD)
LRHRSFTFQEFSQRYATATKLEDTEWRLQGKTNRQVGDEPVTLSSDLQELVQVAQETSLAAYNALIEKGIAKECARMVLPLNTLTSIYMSGTLRSWIHYLDLRCAEGTQKEHREIAIEIKKSLADLFPETFKALEPQVSQ